MPWGDVTVSELRALAVFEVVERGRSVTAVAAEFGITRSCLHKWLRRFAREGAAGLVERSRRPLTSPARSDEALAQLVCEVRDDRPTWGGRKVHRHLQDQGHEVPCSRTVDRVLARCGRVRPRAPVPEPRRFERSEPNHLWQMDFKATVYVRMQPTLIKAVPLSIIDDHSRFALALYAQPTHPLEVIWPVLWDTLGTFGMPQAILTDNDGMFRGRRGGCSAWTARLYRLGIAHLSGRPYHPQTQGKVERFHRTLHEDVVAGSVFDSVAHVQRELDAFRQVYNYERPHEALDLDVPAAHYRPSLRPRPSALPAVEYETGATLRRVHQNGAINVRNCRINVGDGLRGEQVQLLERDEQLVIEYAGFVIRRLAWDQLQKGQWV
jgi:transposase InsO family protein